MTDREARTLAALATAAVDAAVVYGASWLIGHPIGLTALLLVFGGVFALVLALLDGIARRDSDEHDS